MKLSKILLIIIFSIWLSFVVIGCSHKAMNDSRKIITNTEEIDNYRIQVACAVFKNWSFEFTPEIDEKLVTEIVIKVMPNGEIDDIFFVKRSGYKLLDDSAYNAIIKTNPTAPFPKSLVAQYVELGLRFGSKEARSNCRIQPFSTPDRFYATLQTVR